MMAQFQAFQATSRSNTNLLQDPSSYYYLHPSEILEIALTTTLNYHTWSTSVWICLKSKDKIRFIDGTLLKPAPTDDSYDAWDRCNTKDLKHQFYEGDLFRIAELEEDLFSTKQGELSIISYCTKLKRIWEEIDEFRPIPTYACLSNCSDGLDIMRQYRLQSYMIRFLRGLNDQYASMRSHIMLLKPLPDVNTIFSLLLQQERQMMHLIESDSRILMNAVHTKSIGEGETYQPSQGSAKFINTGGEKGKFGANNVRERGRGRHKGGKGTTRGAPKFCSYCGKQGHLVDTCYQKHGFPPHLQPNYSNGVPLLANLVNSVIVVSNTECNPTPVIQNEGKISLDGIFSDRQKEALIALFQQHEKPLHDENLATIHTPLASIFHLISHSDFELNSKD
ncbi:uncharacterized protein LOC107633071 [Arachis ipaensis]|uniref:uncharacterized protein LOC107633071 n=1 Tax=Arachis ipaensis TaxID=130454 RepID=UPI0007AF206B|nr:uncharacterized protein LOC107633071 [Arachis ipaensis]